MIASGKTCIKNITIKIIGLVGISFTRGENIYRSIKSGRENLNMVFERTPGWELDIRTK